jgi:hypothetical protein
MTAAHTTGPWEFVDNALVGPKIDDKPIWLRPVILRSEVGVNQKDANLIAAAPELLEALVLLEKEMVLSGNAGSTDFGWKPAITKTRAAIAKATGEAP